jgi:undecaprenyl-diphosphatase
MSGFWDWLIGIDTQASLWLNGQHTLLLDHINYLLSSKVFWYPFYGVLIGWLIHIYKWRVWAVLVGVAIVIALTDRISSGLFKPTFERLRPCHEPALFGKVELVLGHCGGQFGFLSSHAANTFGLATFLGPLLARRWRYFGMILVFWAATVSFSRVYLGVHYFGDIVAGALLGCLVGWGVRRLGGLLLPSTFRNTRPAIDTSA